MIDPKPICPNDKILATSVGAKDVINKSKVFTNLESSLGDIDILIATSARFRNKNVKHIQLEDLKNFLPPINSAGYPFIILFNTLSKLTTSSELEFNNAL